MIPIRISSFTIINYLISNNTRVIQITNTGNSIVPKTTGLIWPK